MPSRLTSEAWSPPVHEPDADYSTVGGGVIGSVV